MLHCNYPYICKKETKFVLSPISWESLMEKYAKRTNP